MIPEKIANMIKKRSDGLGLAGSGTLKKEENKHSHLRRSGRPGGDWLCVATDFAIPNMGVPAHIVTPLPFFASSMAWHS